MPAQYPPVARQIRAEGEVVLNLDVDASGKVTDAKVVSGAPMLRTAALDAVRRWKYEPATLGDKPVPSTQTVKVDFRLK
jgi:protein TonB